jgi:ceramide glucosyltransferase
VTLLFLSLLALSVLLQLVAVAALEVHRRRFRARPRPEFAPFVSIVKPLSGLDASLEENLESYFRLDYPSYEIVFSFASRSDPAFGIARAVADRYPEIATAFVVDGREPGRNAKVNRLSAGLSRARGSWFLFSDGDTRVPADFLSRAMSWFADPSVGLVSHLFRASGASSLPARLEALYLDGILRPGTAAMASLFGTPCVVGKSILVSRAAINAVGGISRLRDHLAEDFLLGRLVREAGFRVRLSADEIEAVSGQRSAAAVWRRHRRWALLRRRLGGPSYAVEALSSPAPYAAGALLASGGAPGVLTAAAALWVARVAIETVALRRGRAGVPCWHWLGIPLRDLAVAALFWASLAGDQTAWRGRRLRVGPGTILLETDNNVGIGGRIPNKIRVETA